MLLNEESVLHQQNPTTMPTSHHPLFRRYIYYREPFCTSSKILAAFFPGVLRTYFSKGTRSHWN